MLARLRRTGVDTIPGLAALHTGHRRRHHPLRRRRALREAGVAAVFTPKDFGITEIIGRIVDEIRKANQLDPLEVPA